MPEFWSIKEVADYLSVEYKTVYRLVRQGDIPAAKIGGVYRVSRQDLDTYLVQQKLRPPAELAVPPLVKCTVCYRILSDKESGGVCQAEGCGAPICASCWREGHHHCRAHQPSRDDQLQAAQGQLARSEIAVLVSALDAKRRERDFLARFDARVTRITRIKHPLQEVVITPPVPWRQMHASADASDTVMQLLNLGYLDEQIERKMPMNVVSRYEIAPQGPKQPGLMIEARVFSHLRAHISQAFDTQKASMGDLEEILDEITVSWEPTQVPYLVGIASTTGWTAEVKAYVSGDEPGRGYYHPALLLCVIDLESMELTYNATDQRIQALAPLFIPRLPDEEMKQAIMLIERELLINAGVSLDEICRLGGYEPDVVNAAFARLVSQQTHRLVELPEGGAVLSRVNPL